MGRSSRKAEILAVTTCMLGRCVDQDSSIRAHREANAHSHGRPVRMQMSTVPVPGTLGGAGKMGRFGTDTHSSSTSRLLREPRFHAYLLGSTVLTSPLGIWIIARRTNLSQSRKGTRTPPSAPSTVPNAVEQQDIRQRNGTYPQIYRSR